MNPSIQQLEQQIYVIRNRRIMFDRDLALLYQVSTKALNQAVSRNRSRFPSDFMFQLTSAETNSLRSQIVTSNRGRGGRRYLPFVFTEQGVAMLSSVLKSERAVQVNIMIMRAFVRLRALLLSHDDLAKKLEALEKKYAANFKIVFEAIQTMLLPSKPERSVHHISPPVKVKGFSAKKSAQFML